MQTRVYPEDAGKVRVVIRDPRTGAVVKLPASADRQKQREDIRQALADLYGYRAAQERR